MDTNEADSNPAENKPGKNKRFKNGSRAGREVKANPVAPPENRLEEGINLNPPQNDKQKVETMLQSNILEGVGERRHSTAPLTTGSLKLSNGKSAMLQSPALPHQVMCQGMEAVLVTDTGMLRDNNQDSGCVFLSTVPRPGSIEQMQFGLLAVADGMGGHDHGEVASNMVIRSMSDSVMRYFYLPTIAGKPPGREGESPMDVLRTLIEDANQALVQEAYQSRSTMGTTLTSLVIVGQIAFIGHVGDSRLYALERSSQQLRQVTRDHSLVQRLVDMGQLTSEEANNSPQRSILYMSLGQRGKIEVDVEVLPLGDVHRLLLCSDGLWDMVSDTQIEEILSQSASPAEAGSRLVEAANLAGGNDNITVIVAQFAPGD